jgi:hypothetical protein
VSDSAAASGAPGGTPPPGDTIRLALSARSNDIEEAYEYFLGYAAQGLPGESGAGLQVRDYLRKFDAALDGMAAFFTEHVATLKLESSQYSAFIGVIDRDARDTRAAIQLVLAQPSISSQTIDNFNANIHVRALLTDLFLLDEILKAHA